LSTNGRLVAPAAVNLVLGDRAWEA
jgi:hypothetical protein